MIEETANVENGDLDATVATPKLILLGSNKVDEYNEAEFKAFIASRCNNVYPIEFNVPADIQQMAKELMDSNNSENKPATLVNHLPLRDKVLLLGHVFISAFDLVTVNLSKAFDEVFSKAGATAGKRNTPSIIFKVVGLGWTGQDLKLGDDVDILRTMGLGVKNYVYGTDNVEEIVKNFSKINRNLVRAASVNDSRSLVGVDMKDIKSDFNKGTDVIRLQFIFVTDLDNIQGTFKLA